MIFPLLYLHKHIINGEGGIFLKRSPISIHGTNGETKEDRKQFLNQYQIFKNHSDACKGFISLEKNLDQYGGSFLTYEFHKALSEQEIVSSFQCFLHYIKNFYGWNISESKDIRCSDIFQEVKVKIKRNDEILVPLLKGGFRICFLNKNYIILRHRYKDKASLGYSEVAGCLQRKKKTDHFSILIERHYQKIEQSICRNEEIQSSDIGALQHYTLHDKESWNYYLFLLRENQKIYLDYVRTLTTLGLIQ